MAMLAKKKQVSCPRWGQQHLGPPSRSVGKRKFKSHKGTHKQELQSRINEARGYAMLPPGVLESHAVNAVKAETHPAASPPGGGSGNREWSGPTWQFTSFDHPMEAVLNLLGNAELMTPVRVVRKRKDGTKPPRFVPDPDYNGSGKSPPQPDAMHCALDNVTPLNALRNEHLRRTYESNRDRELRGGNDVTKGSSPTWLHQGTQARKKKVYEHLRASVTEQPSPPLLVAQPAPTKLVDKRVMVDNCNDITEWGAANDDDSLDISAYENVGTFSGDTLDDIRQSLDSLSVNISLALYMNGVSHISPYTMVDMAPQGFVNIHHKLENGALYSIRMPEIEFYSLIESGTAHLEPSDMLDETTLSVKAVEWLLQLPTSKDESSYPFLEYTIGELNHHWATWDYDQRNRDWVSAEDVLAAIRQRVAVARKLSFENQVVDTRTYVPPVTTQRKLDAEDRRLNRYWTNLRTKADIHDYGAHWLRDDSAAYHEWLYDHSFDETYRNRADCSDEIVAAARRASFFNAFAAMQLPLKKRLVSWEHSPVARLFGHSGPKPTLQSMLKQVKYDVEHHAINVEIDQQRTIFATRVLFQRVKAERELGDDRYQDQELREAIRQQLGIPEHRLARLRTDELAALVASAGDGNLLTREGEGIYRINFNKEVMPRQGVEVPELWTPPGYK